MKVALLLIGDGRDEIHERSNASAREQVEHFDFATIVDDSDHKLGFAGAIQQGWSMIHERGADYVVHVELDFIFHEPVPVRRMIALLERRPYLAQLALKRQPWNDAEKAAGGIIEQHPDEYVQVTDRGDVFTEHRKFFTTNPSVYSAGFCAQGWPQVEQSEGMFTHRLLADPALRFAFWGAKADPPRVEHIGETRAGHGY